MEDFEVTKADFARYFPSTPAALCIKECARLSSLRKEELSGPLLDIGCGDGVFASIAFPGIEAWGIDINEHETKLAEKSGAYHRVITGDATKHELPQEYFQTCVANCSLEHVPRLDLALKTIYRALKPGGTFITYVPNKDWAESLLSYRGLSLVNRGLAKKLQSSIDEFFRHEHLYDRQGWHDFVANAGFNIVKVEPVLSNATTVAFELMLLPSLIGLANKKLTRRWTNFPALRQKLTTPAYQIVEGAMRVGDRKPTAEFLVVAQKP